MAEYELFGSVDYVLLALVLIASANTGGYFWYMREEAQSFENYLMLDSSISTSFAAFSIMASHLTSVIIIGVPAEMYMFGTHLAFSVIGYFIGTVLSTFIFLPVLHHYRGPTVHKYLGVRFGKWTRILTAGAFLIQMIMFMSAVISPSATALMTVTGASRWIYILCTVATCVIYCSVGGMKSVLWTDLFNSIAVYILIIAIIIKGSILEGGIEKVFDIAREGGRLQIPATDVPIAVRYTFWNVCLGIVIHTFGICGSGQILLQRAFLLKRLNQCRLAMIFGCLMNSVFYVLCCIAGLIIYSYYATCDPVTQRKITSADQLVPYFAALHFNGRYGLLGLCSLSIVCSMLSCISAIIMSAATVTVEDIIKQVKNGSYTAEKWSCFICQAMTIFYGFLCVLISYFCNIPAGAFEAAMSLTSICAGPILGVYILGMFTMNSNEKGAITGLLVGIITVAGIYFTSPETDLNQLPTSTKGCHTSGLNVTHPIHSGSLHVSVSRYNESSLVSYMWYFPIGCVVTIVVGYFISYVAISMTGEKSYTTQHMLSPAIKICFGSLINKVPKQTGCLAVNHSGVHLMDSSTDPICPMPSPVISIKQPTVENA